MVALAERLLHQQEKMFPRPGDKLRKLHTAQHVLPFSIHRHWHLEVVPERDKIKQVFTSMATYQLISKKSSKYLHPWQHIN